MRTDVTIPMLADKVRFDGPDPTVTGTHATKFRYFPADPWAVVFDISHGSGWVRWRFARELLADGVNTSAGEGDVIVFPALAGDSHVFLSLSSPTGSVTLRFTRRDIEHALDRCEDRVPEGSEHTAVDWDQEWARLGGVTG
jgi:hypothetical protein